MQLTVTGSTPHFHPGARLLAERGNIAIINHLAARKVRAGVKLGDRAAPGAARAQMVLVEVKEAAPLTQAQIEAGDLPDLIDVTEPGTRTSKRRSPAILSRMALDDPRRKAAEAYAIASEKIGAVAGASAEGAKTDGGQASNDGGVTTRIHHAQTLRVIKSVTDAHGMALTVGRASPHAPREGISTAHLMHAICIDGRDMLRILSDAGWSGHDRDVRHLMDVASVCLEDMACALGFISSPAPRPNLSGGSN